MRKTLFPLVIVAILAIMLSVSPVVGSGETDLLIDKTVDFDDDGSYTDSESNYPGNTASWKVVVTNNSTFTIENVTVTDTNGHDFGAAFNLTPGESKTFVYSTIVDVDTINIASAQGELFGFPCPEQPVEDDAEALVIPVVGANAQSVNKANILSPWLIIAAIIMTACAVWFILRRHISHNN